MQDLRLPLNNIYFGRVLQNGAGSHCTHCYQGPLQGKAENTASFVCLVVAGLGLGLGIFFVVVLVAAAWTGYALYHKR
jgi:hypothetical protein